VRADYVAPVVIQKGGSEKQLHTTISALELQIPYFTPHNIRHTSASYMANKDVSPAVVASWLGHANLDTVMEYIEIDDQARWRRADD
jgi:integrase